MRQLLAAALLLGSVSAAHAETSKSWTTVKGMLPDNVNVIVGASMSTLRGTSIYSAVMPSLIGKQPQLKSAIDTAKSTCGIDMHAAILDATFALGDDERGVLVATLDKSLDQKKIAGCLEKVVAANAPKLDTKLDTKKPVDPKDLKVEKAPPAKLVTKTTGKITEYGVDVDPKRLYVAWLATDVIAVATDPDDRALLEKMLAGKGMKGAMSTLVAKAPSSSAVWLAATKPQPIPTGGTMKGAFGTIDATKGNVTMDMNIIMGSAKEAKTFVDQATQLIASAKDAIPPQFKKLVDALKLTASSDNANMKLTASEKDIVGLLVLAMNM